MLFCMISEEGERTPGTNGTGDLLCWTGGTGPICGAILPTVLELQGGQVLLQPTKMCLRPVMPGDLRTPLCKRKKSVLLAR